MDGVTEKNWEFHVLGCRGSWPVCGEAFLEFGGWTSCYLVKQGDYAILMDCGTGLFRAKELLADCTRIDILISHVHYDHVAGLLNWGVFPKEARIRFFAPFDHWYGQETLRRFMGPPYWPYTPDMGELVCVGDTQRIELEEGTAAQFHPSCHPDGTSIFRLDGPGWSVCCASDYEHGSPFPDELARGCTLLLYDSMYSDEEYPRHIGWGHSSWQKGCEVAQRLDIPNLLLIHHDPARTDAALRELERQARETYPHLRLARAGDRFDLTKHPHLWENRSEP